MGLDALPCSFLLAARYSFYDRSMIFGMANFSIFLNICKWQVSATFSCGARTLFLRSCHDPVNANVPVENLPSFLSTSVKNLAISDDLNVVATEPRATGGR